MQSYRQKPERSNSFMKNMVVKQWYASAIRSNNWAYNEIAKLHPKSLLDVGCGDGSHLFPFLQEKPRHFCGIEGHPQLAISAQSLGIEVKSVDLNSLWPYSDCEFDAVHSVQVIEHIHNTRLFLAETYRVLKPGGHMIITSENLTSLLNLGALLLGYAPFSLQRVCGWYVGNPLGLHHSEVDDGGVPLDHPAFPGITGHIRVLSVTQAVDLLAQTGFINCQVSSIGLMPLPEIMSKPLEHWIRRRGHWLHMKAQKPF